MLTQTQAQELWAGLKGDQSWTNLSHRMNEKADRHTKKAEFITHFGRAGGQKKKDSICNSGWPKVAITYQTGK